jgi:hypothetical protein
MVPMAVPGLCPGERPRAGVVLTRRAEGERRNSKASYRRGKRSRVAVLRMTSTRFLVLPRGARCGIRKGVVAQDGRRRADPILNVAHSRLGVARHRALVMKLDRGSRSGRERLCERDEDLIDLVMPECGPLLEEPRPGSPRRRSISSALARAPTARSPPRLSA